jgi:DNA-binding transcriptional ArsR family regulator
MASREWRGKEKGRKVRKRSCDDLIDHELMKVLAKPQRVRILAILTERVASPKEISEETGEDIRSLSYHVKVLRDHGLIELERKAPRRGALEHFYRAVSRTLLPADAWDKLPLSLTKEVSRCILREFLDDASDAMQAGVFDDPAGDLSWTPLVLDRLGVEEIGQLATDFLEGVFEAQAKASKRLAAAKSRKTPAERISATVFLASFLSSRNPKEGKKASATMRR